ncbi:MAG: glycosyl hydrolase [Verrucomicrobia bacterium]|nr:glycosyl hydrolase [Verrucomicrobiota bacterium]
MICHSRRSLVALCFAAAGLSAVCGGQLPQADRPLAERFANPPAASRIIRIIHGLPTKPAEQDAQLQTLIRQGFGGFVSNVSFHDYLENEENWRAFVRGVTEAKRAGMSLWLYDERGYPSGLAGGITMRGHPEYEARGLLIADTTSDGGAVALDMPPGKRVLAAAFPVCDGVIAMDKPLDLSAQVKDGRLQWQAPAGRWRVMAITESTLYEGTHAALSLCDKLPYINMLMPEPTARFLEVTHDRYAARLGNDLGRWFVSTFTDEPSLMSLFLRPMPYRVLPWAPNLPAEFRKRRGYALEPLLPALVADAGGKGQRARYDFWNTVGDLVAENYFGQIQQWCHRHNVASGGHQLMEESISSHVPLYGDFFRCARRLDAPSIDCLTSLPPHVPWYIARLLSSVAELEGRTVTMCETSDHSQRYRPAGDKRPVRIVTEEEIRGTCNRLIFGGINTITSYYSFQNLSDVQLQRLNLHIGRCCTMLTGGHQVADIAVLYPIESLWPEFTPATQGARGSPATVRVEHAYRLVSDSLYGAGRDFTYVDSGALTKAKAEDGALVHGKLRWRAVVLPCADTLPLAAWENLARFWRKGGVVIAVGALPANSATEFPSARVRKLAREMFGDGGGARVAATGAGGAGILLPSGSEALLPLVLNGVLEPDVSAGGARVPIHATHRRIDGHEVYFVINDSGEAWEGEVRVTAQGQGEQWNPFTGAATPLAADGRAKLRLDPYGALLLRYAEAKPARRLPITSGGLPGLTLRPLPEVKPAVGCGQFVQAELTGEASRWRAVGTVTKSEVDTHLFLSFNFPQPVDLSGGEVLALETWVPEGQGTPTELLVILHDKKGNDYMAHAGRSLGAPGRCQSFVLLSQFQLAGWSKARDARLDISAVAAIRVGWGGHLGTAGEKVEFATAPPQVGRLANLSNR